MTELERLARVDPVRELPDEDASAQLRAILAQPRRRRRLPRRLVPALALACALAAAVLVATAGGPAAPTTLLDRAYAAVSAGDDVVHEIVSSSWTVRGEPRGSERRESWYRPSTGQVHRRIGGDEGAVEIVVTREGEVLIASADIERLTGRSGLQRRDVGAAFRDKNRRDLAATFRKAVDDGAVTDRGAAQFDGRPARRFEVTSGLDGIDAFDWYVDPVSGRPLGAIERIADQVRTERLLRYEKLEAKGAALAALS
jgi:hypothetical protein